MLPKKKYSNLKPNEKKNSNQTANGKSAKANYYIKHESRKMFCYRGVLVLSTKQKKIQGHH